MIFVPDDDMVRGFSANRSNDPFAERILPRRSGCDYNFLDSHVLDTLSKMVAVDRVANPNNVTRLRSVRRKRVDHLLRCPVCCGMLRHIEVKDSSSAMPENDKAEQKPEVDSR